MNKRILFLFFLPILFSFAMQPQWVKCKNQKTYDSVSAKEVKTFISGDPESMVIYFYASMIRKDDKFKKVLPKDCGRLENDLKEYSTWKFKKFYLKESMKETKDRMYIKIYFEIEFEGGIDTGTDEVTLELINGKWQIIDLPT